jgi:hypothetical protein
LTLKEQLRLIFVNHFKEIIIDEVYHLFSRHVNQFHAESPGTQCSIPDSSIANPS